MLTSRPLLASPSLRVAVVRCPGGGGWGPEEQVQRTSVVLVRRGVFRRRVDGVSRLADPVIGYVQRPGQTQRVAHPAGGDECTSLGVPDELGERLDRQGPLLVSPAADLAHRCLLRRLTPVDRADAGHHLLALLLPEVRWHDDRRHDRRVDQVRAALHEAPLLPLADLAAVVGWSPWYLSRIFHRVTGMTVRTYRRRLRIRAALDALAAGAGVADVAVRTGFADQAHLTRAMRQEIGSPPAATRRLLLTPIVTRNGGA